MCYRWGGGRYQSLWGNSSKRSSRTVYYSFCSLTASNPLVRLSEDDSGNGAEDTDDTHRGNVGEGTAAA